MATQCVGVGVIGAGLCLLLYLSAGSAWIHPAGRHGAARLLAGLNGDVADLGLGWEAQAQAQAQRGRRGSSSAARGWRASPGAFLGGPPAHSLALPAPAPAPADRDMEQQLANAVGGLGVLTDLNSFFNNLQENLESMENSPQAQDERRSPDEVQIIPQTGATGVAGRPLSSPALMYSLRNFRPSHKTRTFVETSEPAALRRSNQHDPQLLWAGLGR